MEGGFVRAYGWHSGLHCLSGPTGPAPALPVPYPPHRTWCSTPYSNSCPPNLPGAARPYPNSCPSSHPTWCSLPPHCSLPPTILVKLPVPLTHLLNLGVELLQHPVEGHALVPAAKTVGRPTADGRQLSLEPHAYAHQGGGGQQGGGEVVDAEPHSCGQQDRLHGGGKSEPDWRVQVGMRARGRRLPERQGERAAGWPLVDRNTGVVSWTCVNLSLVACGGGQVQPAKHTVVRANTSQHYQLVAAGDMPGSARPGLQARRDMNCSCTRCYDVCEAH